MSVVGILGKKVGMTQIFDERGDIHPVTVLKAGPCVITQLKTLAKDGYEAAQIGYVDFVKASKVNKAMTGHFAKSDVPPVRMIREVGLEAVKTVEGEEKVTAKAGDRILVDIFEGERFVDVIGVSKGHGFQGVVKRHKFEGGPRSHGQKHSEREPGSIGGGGRDGGRVAKGKRMAGRMGSDRITVKNLKLIQIDSENKAVLISGAIPGRRGTLVEIKAN